MIAKSALLVGFLALFVVGSAVVPIQAQTQEERVQAGQDEQVFNRIGQPVTVRVTNDNWLDMRIYVVETATQRRRWRLGTVTGLTTANFELPDHLGAELGLLVLVAAPIGSREQQSTERLVTLPGALVRWRIASVLSLSFAFVS